LRGVEHSDVRHQPTPLPLKGPCDAQGWIGSLQMSATKCNS
jgi:hypothetical protein